MKLGRGDGKVCDIICVCGWMDDEDKSMHGKGVAFTAFIDGHALDGVV